MWPVSMLRSEVLPEPLAPIMTQCCPRSTRQSIALRIGRSRSTPRRDTSITTRPIADSSALPDPVGLGDGAPALANSFVVGLRQRTGGDRVGIMLPSSRPSGADNRGMDTGDAQRESKRHRDRLARRRLQEIVIEPLQPIAIGPEVRIEPRAGGLDPYGIGDRPLGDHAHPALCRL